MDRVGDLMRQMGFREDADDDTKKAFIKHLVKAAFAGKTGAEEDLRCLITMVSKDTQLSFDLSYDLESAPHNSIKKSG